MTPAVGLLEIAFGISMNEMSAIAEKNGPLLLWFSALSGERRSETQHYGSKITCWH